MTGAAKREGHTQREPVTEPGRHEVLRVLADRVRRGSRPGERRDGHRVALAIEGGGMRGTISAGMALALYESGMTHAFDAVYGASAGRAAPPGTRTPDPLIKSGLHQVSATAEGCRALAFQAGLDTNNRFSMPGRATLDHPVAGHTSPDRARNTTVAKP
ncbi:hypothetical protein Misp01_11300 [Microtetraspora sp. NBRC 13810]|uniref:hypothetical protein n=1 Tax=Microtetraspora sp. NBRC 13810 TaxID=3030990 RepID=UPI0024A55AB7|nr:hypothetical protein [Microtetraspora sp. NBRC 13810]GLW06000.1 hypothetical protein Misp01_11300 [Microtetraspora sp. NBRC 13810]